MDSRLRVGGLSLFALALMGATPSNTERGRKLFAGELPLTARIVMHEQVLPQDAVRCTNCHQAEAGVGSPERKLPASSEENFGPTLGTSTLARAVARRGGPPSRYDVASFCKLLRQGIDPAHVVVQQAMPRYTMRDDECEALWTFLNNP